MVTVIYGDTNNGNGDIWRYEHYVDKTGNDDTVSK